MKKSIIRRLLLLLTLAVSVAGNTASPAAEYPLKLADIRVRDPFIVADASSQTYYLYAQTGNRKGGLGEGVGVEVYRSRDLTNWSEPTLAYRKPAEFWGGKQIWAPEVHLFGDAWFMFVTFNGREGGRGTMILRAAKPDGPFELIGPDAGTPPEQRALDGTPFVDEQGTNWLVYCHEWAQIGDGKMLAVKMKPDWSGRIGEPVTLFKASDAPWEVETTFDGRTGRVTDGPCLYRARDGRLLMLWSSFTGQDKSYAIGLAECLGGRIQGPWRQQAQPWLAEHGGHCMLFTNFAGQLMLAWHQPNASGKERAHLQPIIEMEGKFQLLVPGESTASTAQWSTPDSGKRVLLVGGGKHHDYPQWFDEADSATLRAAGFEVIYTCEPETATRLLPGADVLVFSSGLGWPATPEFRAAYEKHRAAGKGIVGLHSGLWINWRDWPEFNRGFGLAANSHPVPAPFTITKLVFDHPLSAAIPDHFTLTDELYHTKPFPDGAPVKVIAETSSSPKTHENHPSFWVVDEPGIRVAGIAPGHDGRTHTNEIFQKWLVDTVRWAAKPLK